MSASKGIALDANILIRAVLGTCVRSLLEKYEDSAEFYTPDVCFEQAREHLPAILGGRGVEPQWGLAVLKEIELLVEPVDRELYKEHEEIARERMSARDIEDRGDRVESQWVVDESGGPQPHGCGGRLAERQALPHP